MNDFEISTDNFDPTQLRRKPAAETPVAAPAPAGQPHIATDAPAQPAPKQAAANTASRNPGETQRHATHHEGKSFAENVRTFFGDGRFRIFMGLVLVFLATYMLVVSISFLSDGAADQSIVHGKQASEIAASHEGVKNSGGWFGAFLAHLLVYRWLGIGAFIFIFYVAAVGVGLVRGRIAHFWQLSFKCLVSAIALSVIAGFVTYSMTNPTFWGGEHGYFINNLLISNASMWAGLGVSLLLLVLIVLIFLKPIAKVCRTIARRIKAYRQQLAERHEQALKAAAVNAPQPEQQDTDNEIDTQSEPDPTEFTSVTPAQQTPRQPAPDMADVSGTPFSPDFYPATQSNETTLEEIPSRMPQVTVPELRSETMQIGMIDTPADTVATAVADDESLSAETTPEPAEQSVDETDVMPFDTPIELADIPVTDISDDETPTAEPMPDNVTESDEKEETVDNSDDIVMEINPGDSEAQPDREEEIEEEPSTSGAVMMPASNTDIYDPRADLSHYRFPSIDLLNIRESTGPSIDEEEQEENKQRIINSLQSYGIGIEKITATIGPTITLYEIIPAQGVRIAKIKRLGDDMALSLAALGIRIIAPIPGKGTIGMEVPNKNPQVVSIRSILSSKAYRESKAALPIAMGTTISKDVYVTDLAKMPHLLVAGATGMGKSVGLNTIIASLLFKKHPAELKFVLVDPKVVEFSLYRVIERHFLAKLPEEEKAIITEPDRVAATLNSLCVEMENRYRLLSDAGMRTIAEYNEKFVSRRLNPEKGHRFLPYIVVIIDEFGDLILTAGKEIETPISRIAAKARAVGIHMILATQRPSVNVITGVIKANFPGRIAFRVTSRIDSQTILDRNGADQLVGRGDMLISRDGVVERVQCAFIDTDEVERMCDFISHQQAYPEAYPLPDYLPAQEGGGANAGGSGDRDPLFIDAGYFIIDSGIGSTSSIQRKFEIGYPRAGKIMDQLEMAGVVGPAQGGKARKVLMDRMTFEMTFDK